MIRDALLIARKDLLIEWRSRVTINQVAPLGLLILIVFAFAFDANRNLLTKGAPGLVWVGVLFAGVLTVQRSFTIESADGITDALRLSSISPVAMFLGKAAAVGLQLFVLEIVLVGGAVVFFDSRIGDPVLLIAAAVTGTGGFSAIGCIYGAMSLGVRVRETLLPLLLIPVVAPILLAGTRAFERALDISTQAGWNWVGLLGVMWGVYLAVGTLAFGPLLEDG
ncbi:MAG: ABC transporter permease [Actinomycetia bacterium]|nr:ABC transporter permease [Actinomycetes bacterium]MCP4960733.1 ABC transporter permease [Actinomycetes bacterium]